jgi:TfoX/Sxy family transcriptional regulator of competence genes
MGGKDDYLRWVLEQLSGAGGISSRRMFGAVGLYRNDVFFAIVSDDTLFFKVSGASRTDFEARGMARFRPYRDKPQMSMNYYEVRQMSSKMRKSACGGRCARWQPASQRRRRRNG